ncbi:BREX system serine/threonine kinase PglW [Actinomadura oligospora]|uniref:BREX system serine/threonine kinase PglW n=1 Tax=Actinomadura oligospora TaxID=111804 RepID=UPI00047CD480|nr:BREX system serine/threonine kinase PglW [Actinomadura oligospora]
MADVSGPVPRPPRPQRRWFQELPSEYPWEQEGLDFIRNLMPRTEPYRAWATFSFTARSGRVNECDLFIATPGGLYLVELKGHRGEVSNNGGWWTFRYGTARPKSIRNPLHLTDQKSKELKNQLQWAVHQVLPGSSLRIPRIEPAVFLSDTGLVSQLDEVQDRNVYGRDDVSHGLSKIWADLLGRPPQSEARRVGPLLSQHLPRLMEAIGITHSLAHLDFGDGWKLDSDVLDSGPTWEDRLAARTGLVHEAGRVRVYLVGKQATQDTYVSVERAARREYEVLQGINHRGIAQAQLIRDHRGAPAILFRHDPADQPLETYLDQYASELTPETRLDLVRQLAEAVRYAHHRSLYHRALAARSVYVSSADDGSRPVLRIIDWQAAARDFDTSTTIGNSPQTDAHLQDTAQVYLAPEFEYSYADPVELDVFGMGAVAYLILTGEQPAPDRPALIDRVSSRGAGGLHPYAVADGLTDDLDQLVYRATAGEPALRLASADEFLDLLDEAEEDNAVPTGEPGGQDWEVVDPLLAQPGQAVDGDAEGPWRMERQLGTGGTARAILVTRSVEDGDGEEVVQRRVLKVALDESRADRLQIEAEALAKVGGGAVVKLYDGPRQVAGRTVLDLEFAGDRTLARVLTEEGRLTYHQLERFSEDLFRALDQLAAEGLRHRDLKPENFGVLLRADRTWALKLLDFSHAGVSDSDITAGTRGYVDPFVGELSRPFFDDHAEWYAAAVTLHEMASSERPVWGDGKTDPRTADDDLPRIAEDVFEPALREGLTAYFRKALHRDVAQRFESLAQMTSAWRAIFQQADQTAPVGAPTGTPITASGENADPILDRDALQAARDAAAEAATLETPLEAAGLSPRGVSVARGFGAATVGQLLRVPPYLISRARGAGAIARKELNLRHRQWTAKYGTPEPTGDAGDKTVAGSSSTGPATPSSSAEDRDRLRVDELAALLVPSSTRKNSSRNEVLRLLLGLPAPDGTLPDLGWPTQGEVAKRHGLTQATVSRHHKAATADWAAASWLDPVRAEIVERLDALGGVATAGELSAALRVRHGAASGLTPETVAAMALAVVRAAVEAEMYVGVGQSEEDEPRLARLRRRGKVLVALESLPGTDDPTPSELADYADKLGGEAASLAEAEPLPGRAEVLRALRAVAPPEGMGALADARLIALAAAVAPGVLMSPGMQLYRRDLPLAKALRLAQAGAGVRHPDGITLDRLMSKVQAAFPGLNAYAPSPTYITMEAALKDAGFPLVYSREQKRFLPPAPAPALTSSITATSKPLGRGVATPEQVHQDAVAAKLDSAHRQGGFLALTVHYKRLPGLAEALATRYPVVLVDVAEVFLTEFRKLADEQGVDWSQVLRADERMTEQGKVPGGLRSFVTRVMDSTRDTLLNRETGVLLLHNAGLLARYFDVGGRQMLADLQKAARRPGDAPHGLWLLCPSESPRALPNLDGRTVEAIGGDAEWVVLDRESVERLHGPRAA